MVKRYRRKRGGADQAPGGPAIYEDEAPAYPGYLEAVADRADEATNARPRRRAAPARQRSSKPTLWARLTAPIKRNKLVSRGLRALGAHRWAARADQAGWGKKRRKRGGARRALPAKTKAAFSAFKEILAQVREQNPGMPFRQAQLMASKIYHRH